MDEIERLARQLSRDDPSRWQEKVPSARAFLAGLDRLSRRFAEETLALTEADRAGIAASME